LNSDIGVYGDKLYLASGGSHTVVELNVEEGEFKEPRVLDCTPDLWKRAQMWRQKIYNLVGAFARRPTLINTHLILAHHGRYLLRPHLPRWQVPGNRKSWVQRTD
jgi:hypothetical protein